jgi:hypothetical protein
MTEAAAAIDEGSSRLRRTAGILLLLTALTMTLALVLSDPAIEEHHLAKVFTQQVEKAADRAPAIYVFQVVDVVRGLLTAGVGIALYLLLRGPAQGLALAGLVMFAIAGVFAAGEAFIGAATTNAAQLYVGGHLQGIGAGSSDLLAMIQVFTVLHFAFFLTTFAALGVGMAAFSRSYGPSHVVPRWLATLGLVSGALLCTSWLTFIHELLFLPFFFGGLLSLVWLIALGVRLTRTA